jgi:hypothetical protein
VFLAAAGLALVAAVASALRGKRYVHSDEPVAVVVDDAAVGEVAVPPVASEPSGTGEQGAPVSARLAP